MAVSKEAIKKILITFDDDWDGKLTHLEVVRAQRATGVLLEKPEEEKFERILGDDDMDHETAAEAIVEFCGDRQPRKELERMFAALDSKHDGTVGASELRAVMYTLREYLMESDIDRIICMFDSGNDRIDYVRLINYLAV